MNLKPRTGLTLIELIIGITLMAMIATALSVMTEHVLQVSTNVERLNESTQMDLVIKRQLDSLVSKAIATVDFPGVMYVQTSGAQSGIAVRDVAGASLPQQQEIVFLTHDPSNTSQWCVFRARQHTNCPAVSDTAAWSTFFSDTIGSVASEKKLITNRIALDTSNQPVIRWSHDISPTAAEIQNYRDGFVPWDQLPWPQGKFTAERGLQRQQLSIMLMILDRQGHAVPVHLNHSVSISVTN